MELWLIALIAVCLVLAGRLAAVRREVKHLYRQLNALKDGSHIELTSVTGNRGFLRLYRKLNDIFAKYQKEEAVNLRSQKLLKQTISSLAHDIRTPLTGAMGYLQLLEESGEPKKQERYCASIRRRLEELKNLLEELFLYTKLTSPDFTLECNGIPVFSVLSECMVGMYRQLEQCRVEPEIQFEQEGFQVRANREATERIFTNLIQNALKHGTGTLRIVQQGQELTFSNSVSREYRIDPEQIFDRFYQAAPSGAKGSSGLGLAVVKELMERMGGKVWATVREGELEIHLRFCSTNGEAMQKK